MYLNCLENHLLMHLNHTWHGGGSKSPPYQLWSLTALSGAFHWVHSSSQLGHMGTLNDPDPKKAPKNLCSSTNYRMNFQTEHHWTLHTICFDTLVCTKGLFRFKIFSHDLKYLQLLIKIAIYSKKNYCINIWMNLYEKCRNCRKYFKIKLW